MTTTNIKEKLLWKINWIKNASEICTAQAVALSRLTAETVPVKTITQKEGSLWGTCTPDQLIKCIEKNHGIYELLHKFPQKVYFDIDSSEALPLEIIMEHIESLFPNGEFAVSGSVTDEKTSYHIISNKYVIRDEAERIQMKTIVMYMQENLHESFDTKVYTKNRCMKCINQSKLDGRVQSIITVDDYKKHMITCFFSDFLIPLPVMNEKVELKIQIEKSKVPFNLGTLPKLVLNTPQEIDFKCITPFEILKLLPLSASFDFAYTHLVARFCYHSKISFDDYLSWLLNKNPSIVKNEQGVKKWNELEQFPPVSMDRIKTILVYYYPQIKKDKTYRDFAQTFNLPVENIVGVETMSQDCFTGPEKYSVCSIGMGGGKTAQTIDYLADKHSFCWICPNKALASNTQKRLEDKSITATHYLDVHTKLKKNGDLNEYDKLIIVLNSLHYLQEKSYDIIVIDEVETMFDKFLGEFLEQKESKLKLKIWNQFIHILRTAGKVIFLDAFITTKTTNFIKMLEGNLDSTKIYIRLFEPTTRTINYVNGVEMMIDDIINKIKKGSKVFIFYPHKNQVGKIASMSSLNNLISEKTGKEGIFYNADADDKVKKGLKDVNVSWADKSFVITNNIITCGVNYEGLDFDYKYLFIAPFNSPRDIIQVSYRARYLSTGIIKICYMGAMNQVNAWTDDCHRMDDPLYKMLYKSILVEKKAPIKKSFQLFCVKAHYKQTTDTSAINKVIQKEIRELLEQHELGFSYDTIPDISSGSAEHLQQLCFAQEATMLDKMQLQKYFFKMEFTEKTFSTASECSLTNHETIAEVWDRHYLFFFNQLKYVLSTPTCVFNKIMELNKLESIFPVDIKKTKLSPEIIEQIFTEFSFKIITKTSSPYKILKEIYNVYFGKHVVATTFGTDKNVKYEVDEYYRGYYEFAKEYLLLDKEARMTFNNCQELEEHACEF